MPRWRATKLKSAPGNARPDLLHELQPHLRECVSRICAELPLPQRAQARRSASTAATTLPPWVGGLE